MAFLTKSSDKKTQGNRTRPTGHSLRKLPLQAKLRLGQPKDAFEQEADKMADKVVNTPTNKDIQRQGKEEEEKPVQTQPLASEISRYIQKQGMEEKEPVQAQMEEEEEPVQTQMEEEEPVQTQSEEEEPVQTQTEAITNTDNVIDDPEIEQLLASTKSGGEALEPEILQEMESKFNTSFAHVRIHRDSTAAELNRRFNAKAFTHGSHIYFNEGQYDPTGTEGKRLLAHELTHVVQQTGGVQREMIQRFQNSGSNHRTHSLIIQRDEDPDVPTMVNENTYRGSEGIINRNNGLRMTLPTLSIPSFKQPFTPSNNLVIRRGRAEGESRNTNQRQIWDSDAREGSGLNQSLDQKLSQAHPFGSQSNPIYYLRIGQNRGDPTNYLIGTRTDIRNRILRPYWTPSGRILLFEVDHQREYQLNGEDIISNLWLLERKANGSSGRNIDREIQRRVDALLNASRDTEVWRGQSPPDFREAKRQFDEIKFESIETNLPVDQESGGIFSYNLEEIKENATQLQPIEPLSLAQVESEGLQGSETQLIIFNNRTGGRRHSVDLPNAEVGQVPFTNNAFLPGFRPQTAIITPEQDTIVTLQGQLWSDNPALTFHGARTQIEIAKFEGLNHTGRLNVNQVRSQIESLFGSENITVPSMSPIQMTTFEVEGEGMIVIMGKVITNIPLIDGADIDIAIRGNDIRLEKTFSTSDITIPGPIEVTNSSLTVAIGTESGFSLTGQVNLEIPEVGTGLIRAEARTGRRGGASAGFSLTGRFDFDRELFDRADVTVSYEATEEGDRFTVEGNIGIPEGKVRGIKNATINVSYSEDTLTAEGDAELDIRGVERGTLSVTYSPEGWSIGGTFNLSNDIPGIRSGSISATVSKVTGEEGYQLTARGTAIPDIPGISSELSVEYDNGAITIQGRAAYNRGLLSGEINVGATNRTLDDTGQPTGDPTDTFIVYGGGSLTIQITPWLQGTVGFQFQPDGQIIVSGRIALPSSIDVFDRIGIPERELFGIGFDIPIFAIPVGPKSIGLVASIRGGLKFHAGIGPGRLEGVELGLTYNPEHPEQTHVTGAGRFVIPAEAGLSLFVRATIGLSAVVGGVEGGLELAGGLGLEAEASAGINVDWTPETGLELRADLGAYVQPKFVFTIDGVIRAWILFYDKEWRWRLADYEYGPDLRFGVNLPIVYREGEPFNVSFDDLEVQYPNIDASSFIGGLIRDIRGSRS